MPQDSDRTQLWKSDFTYLREEVKVALDTDVDATTRGVGKLSSIHIAEMPAIKLQQKTY